MYQRTYQVVSVLLILLLITSCNTNLAVSNPAITPRPQVSPDQICNIPTPSPHPTIKIELVPRDEDYAAWSSLDDLVATSTYILIGVVTESTGLYNGAYNVRNTTEPADNAFGISQGYTVQVEHYLKGSGPQALSIVQGQGSIFTDVTNITANQIEAVQATEIAQQKVTPLQLQSRYLFFVTLLPARVDVAGCQYSGRSSPWYFRIAEDDSLILEAPGVTASRFSIPNTATAAWARIEQIVRTQQKP